MFDNVMMVCVGNICRSPMAEVLLQDMRPNIKVISSGIGALVGKPADPIAVQIMEEQGIDLSKHCAQQINTLLVSKMDLILTMEPVHLNYIQANYPSSRGKVYLIGKWDGDTEIVDPYKKEREAFEKSFQDINLGLKGWLKRI